MSNNGKQNRGKGVPFSKGNQLWRQVKTPGRIREFSSPEDLWSRACEYFEWASANPILKRDVKVVDKELQDVDLPLAIPFTMGGLCVFLGINDAYFRNFKQDKTKCTEAFSTVISQIEKIVYEQKFSGAAAGIFNANIISRDLGLVDKQQTESHSYSVQMTKDEMSEIKKQLEDEY